MRGTFLLSRAAVPDPEGCRQPAHPVAVAAAEPHAEVARRAHRLHAREVRHDDGDARASRRSSPRDGIAANTLWPRTTIATAAVQFALGGDRMMRVSRTPEIYADAAYEVLTQPVARVHGADADRRGRAEDAGVTDFARLRRRAGHARLGAVPRHLPVARRRPPRTTASRQSGVSKPRRRKAFQTPSSAMLVVTWSASSLSSAGRFPSRHSCRTPRTSRCRSSCRRCRSPRRGPLRGDRGPARSPSPCSCRAGRSRRSTRREAGCCPERGGMSSPRSRREPLEPVVDATLTNTDLAISSAGASATSR